MSGNGSHLKRGWAAIVHFLTHSFVGSVIFVIIAIPAFFIGHGVHELEKMGASRYVLFLLTGLEYFILTVDVLLFAFLLLKSMYKAAKELEL